MSRKPVEPARKEQNEYIPAFISKKPFYLDAGEGENDYLEHQRLQGTSSAQNAWYDRGKRTGPAATKYRKGACENCGAMTHKTKQCLSRPRAKGAKWTGKDIQADEVLQEIQLGWDAKRDRWNGYNAEEYQNVVKDFEEVEKMRQQLKTQKEPGDLSSRPDEQEADNNDIEEVKYAEESDMGREQSTATRNLRLREDTAKYLLNLDLDSAKYDPKTRSMVNGGAQADQTAALVEEDNFMRASGDAAEFERAQRYAWESQERGDKNKTHLQANPTAGEVHLRQERQKNMAQREAKRKELFDKYGGEQHIRPQEDEYKVTESNQFVEYDVAGGIKEKAKVDEKSKYPEDVLINNHLSVWGSWWSEFNWGYACCHSLIKNSYCTGEEGKSASNDAVQGQADLVDQQQPEELVPQFTEAEPESKLAQGKRFLLTSAPELREEEMERYKRARVRSDDPMANSGHVYLV